LGIGKPTSNDYDADDGGGRELLYSPSDLLALRLLRSDWLFRFFLLS